MRKTILYKDDIVKGSVILFLATLGLNISGYIFHLFMGRFLGPEGYGILGTILSIIYIISVPALVVQFSLSKFVSKFKTSGEKEKINELFRRSYRKLSIIGIVITLGLALSIPLTSSFLNIPSNYLLMLSPVVFFIFLNPINRSFFQGMQKFNLLGANLASEGIAKLVLGIGFVIFGLGISGAILALVISSFIPITIGFFSLRKFAAKTPVKIESYNIYKYSFPFLICLTFLTSLYTIDIFLVRYFFDGVQAGYYVAASFFGKIILFVSTSITMVLFPHAVKAFELKAPTNKILKKSIILMLIPCITITLSYFIFPEIAIYVFFGGLYYPASSFLGLFGLAMSLFSFIYILSIYNLSVNRTKFIYFIIAAAIAEASLIYILNKTIAQILIVLNSVFFLLLISLILYTLKYIWKR